MRQHGLDAADVVVMSGDDVVVTKAGKTTYGLDRFFSSLYGKAVPGRCFLSLSLLSVKRRMSYPVVTEQVEKACAAAAQAQSTKQFKGQRGHPPGSKNRNRREVELSPSLRFIQEHIKSSLKQIGDAFKVVYFILTVSWVITMPCKWSDKWVCMWCRSFGIIQRGIFRMRGGDHSANMARSSTLGMCHLPPSRPRRLMKG
jgi:DDE superfamily endonuclease